MSSIGLDKLMAWEESLRKQAESLHEARQEIESKLQKVSRQLELVRQMRDLEEGSTTVVENAQLPKVLSEPRTTPANVRESAKQILVDAGGPLHINEIHRRFAERGYPIPGAGTPFNILVHLTNDKSFVRVARGTYAVAGSVPEEQVLKKAPPVRKTRKHRIKRSRG